MLYAIAMGQIMIFHVHKNVGKSFFRFVTIHAFDRRTDRQTDRKALEIPCIALHAVAQ